MAKQPRVPGTPGNGGDGRPVQQVQIPVIELGAVRIQMGERQNQLGQKQKVLLIGPLMLALPLDEDGAKALVQGLTGVEIVKAGQFPFKDPGPL